MPNTTLPHRDAKIITHYTNPIEIPRNGNYIPLENIVSNCLKSAEATVNDNPRYFYIFHAKKDSELAARSIKETISENSNNSLLLLDKVFKENTITDYIKKSSLKRAAKNYGLWQQESIVTIDSLVAFLGWFVSTIISIFTLFISFFAPGNIALEFLQKHGLEKFFPIFGFVFGVISLLILWKLISDQMKKAFRSLDETITSMSDSEYISFIENFSAEDFKFLNLKSKKENISIICLLSRYNMRQRAVLKRYWMTNNNREYWWIFVEKRLDNSNYILDKSNKYERQFISLLPYTTTQKRDLAKKYGRDIQDPGIRDNGVDYVASSTLHLGITPTDKTLNQRIEDFIQKEQNNFSLKIRPVVYLIAELSTKYRIDFSSGKYWEYLFEYPANQKNLVELDKQVSKELFFASSINADVKHLNSLRYLIPLILNEFLEDLGNIAFMHESQIESSCFTQLCIIKALRYRNNQENECCLAIAETLYYTMKNALSDPKGFCTKIWISIFTEVLTLFEAIHYGCFSPAYLHILIEIYNGSKDKLIQKLFSIPIVIRTAKENIFLNNSTDVDAELDEQNIDVIYDHFRILELAILAKGKGNILTKSGNIPESFGLLNLTELQRRKYFFALEFLGEKDILSYYDLLFDIYCATLDMSRVASFVKPIIRKNLITRYGHTNDFSGKACLKKALHSLAEQLKLIYSNHPLVKQDLPNLINLIDRSDDDILDESLFYLAKWEAFSFVTGSFIACMLCHLNESLENYKDIYLNMGNYLIRLVFLSNFESREESFVNADFQYLIRILTSYKDPCQVVLTHLAFLGQRSTPNLANQQIGSYLLAHKNVFQQNLIDIQKKLDKDEIESYIVYIYALSFGQTNDEKRPVFVALQKLLTESNSDFLCSSLVIELLNSFIDGTFSEEFYNRPFSNILNELNAVSPDIVYMVYSEMVEQKDSFLEYCPVLAESLLKSIFVGSPLLLAEYLFYDYEKNRNNNDYIKVAHLFYNHCCNRFHSKNLMAETAQRLTRYQLALNLLKAHQIEAPDDYTWIDSNVIEKMNIRCEENRNHIFEVAAKVTFRERKWGRYGLLFYLKFLLTNTPFPYRITPDYEKLNEKDKLNWIEANIDSIHPIITTRDVRYINIVYIAMLDMFLNNEKNIQERESELDILNRVATDAKQALNIIINDEELRIRIHNMIDEYCQAIRM